MILIDEDTTKNVNSVEQETPKSSGQRIHMDKPRQTVVCSISADPHGNFLSAFLILYFHFCIWATWPLHPSDISKKNPTQLCLSV